MPRQRGNMKLEGTMNDMTFYKMRNKYFARAKRQVSRERILTDPKFARVRENGNEFGMAVKAGKLLRDTVKFMYREAGGREISTRVLQLMLKIQKLDVISPRGKRSVGNAFATAEGKKLLKGFDFNSKAQAHSILFKPYTVNPLTGEITIADFIPANDLAAPEGATHVVLKGAYANINFTDGVNAIEFTNELTLHIDGISTTITLTPAAVPAETGTKLYFLQIKFLQIVNGVLYDLKDSLFNVLVIAEVE